MGKKINCITQYDNFILHEPTFGSSIWLLRDLDVPCVFGGTVVCFVFSLEKTSE